MICPNCGATLDVTKTYGKIKCSYCFTKVPIVLEHNCPQSNSYEYVGCNEYDYNVDNDEWEDNEEDDNIDIIDNMSFIQAETEHLESKFSDYYKQKRSWNITRVFLMFIVAVISSVSCLLIELELIDIGASLFLFGAACAIISAVIFTCTKPVPPPPAKNPSKILTAIAQFTLFFLFILLGMFVTAFAVIQ